MRKQTEREHEKNRGKKAVPYRKRCRRTYFSPDRQRGCQGSVQEGDEVLVARLNERIRKLERELFHVWDYIGQEGCWSEAKEYVEEHKAEAIPFESLL